MRGKPDSGTSAPKLSGITPADAGKTYLLLLAVKRERDHPRGCGENFSGKPPNASAAGSPPRMRGKLPVQTGAKIELRITPADAGKTDRFLFIRHISEDHPRGCGENFLIPHLSGIHKGSPPRMRGKLFVPADISTKSRITPADAGKTVLTPAATSACRDHPRGCGENTKKIL